MLPLRDNLPTRSAPVVTCVLIAANILVYCVAYGEFSLGGVLHLGCNVLYLWIFGRSVEDSIGRMKFSVFFLLGAIAAMALYVIVDPDSTVPALLGASGAISAVLGGYAALLPRAKVVTVSVVPFFFTVLELPALLVLGTWFLLQALFASFDPADAAVYVGGFVFGLAAIRLFAQRRHERIYARS